MDGELQRRVGLNLRAYRERTGMSQEDFAHEIAGWHRTHQSAVERGVENLTLKSLERLADKLDVDPLDLLRDPSQG